MNDDQTLAIIRDRLAEARDGLGEMPRTITASQIIARTRQRRTRRRLAAAGTACAAAGIAAGLALAPGSATRPAPRHAQLAAWTVHTNRDGTVTFTLRNTSHPAQLERALAKAGVAAVVRSGEVCMAVGPGQTLLNTSDFMKDNAAMAAGVGSYFAVQGVPGQNPDLGWSWTLTPSKMPRGGQFVISAIPHAVPAQDLQAVWEFAKASAPVKCAKLVQPGQEP
jgi:hypothetical protein